MSRLPNERLSQPGLELAPPSDPEVVPLEKYATPISQPVYGQPTYAQPAYAQPAYIPYKSEGSYFNDANSPSEPYSAYGEERGLPLPPPAAPVAPSRKKLYIGIGIVAAIAVIVAAVVGGVVGSRAGSNGSNSNQVTNAPSSATPAPNSAPDVQVNTTAVRPNTKLSITGRRLAGNGFTSRLFWQGGDNKIRAAKYNSAGGSWSSPIVFDTLDAKPGTPIAATQYLAFPQFEVFYADPSSTFQGINFAEDETIPKIDSINTDRPAFTTDSTRWAAYWPYVVYQNPNTTFHRIVYDSRGRGWFNDTMLSWNFPDVMPTGDNGTAIALVPTVTTFKGPYAAGIAYRDKDGQLAVFSFGGVDTGISWYSGTPKVKIPAGTAIAATANSRGPNSNTTNTWILYQDDDHKIQAVWQDDGAAWKGPQEVGDADPGTDIACLTEQVGDDPSIVVLSERTDMRRCYYQYKGMIREKRLTASTWTDGDTIPME